jgi:hypothetical protein
MKLTIIPSDGAVYENGVCYSNLTWAGTPIDVHALQWLNEAGWIEFNDGKQNQEIDSLPDWANNAMAAWTVANTPKPPSPPTVEENKATASQKLYETDWTTIPDVSDSTKSNPYLTNVSEFLTYRNTVRQYAINPIAGNIDWPTIPTSVWAPVSKLD